MKTGLFIFIAALCSLLNGAVLFTNAPKPLQLYPRDALDSAVVAISGIVTGTANDSITVKVTKGALLFYSATQPLVFSGDTARFAFSPKIHAELAEYSFQVLLDTMEVLKADSVVCGDAFLISGQSNATGTYTTGTLKSEWVRSFGTAINSTVTDSAAAADTTWGRAHSSNKSHLFIGYWGLSLAKFLADSVGIPICILNGARPGSAIVENLRNNANPLDLTTYYGRLLYRARKARIADDVKGFFWHQGETDSRDATADSAKGVKKRNYYIGKFDTLYASWRQDYPALKKCYLYQIRPRFNIPEAQRQIAMKYPDVGIMSTSGDAPILTDGTHFTGQGYLKFAEWMYPLVKRDLYGSGDTSSSITPPNIQRAFYCTRLRDEIVIEFDQPVLWGRDTTIIAGVNTIHASLKDYFALDTVHGLVDTGFALPEKRCIILRLSAPVNAASISYLNLRYYLPWSQLAATDSYNHLSYQGPWLTNARGVGALTFEFIPLATDTAFFTRAETGGRETDNQLSALRAARLSAFPNPLTGSVTFRLEGLKNRKGTISIYREDGGLYRKFPLGKEGESQVVWNGSDENGNPAPIGRYLVSFTAHGAKTISRVVMLIR